MREHEWINTPEARQCRGERSLFALTDILNALDHGHTPPSHAMTVMQEISRETARAGAWRTLDRLRREDPLEPLTEPRQYDWDESPQEAARRDRMYWNEDS
ncbi:hypothetical protein ACWDBO_31465 [Streptomyces mirabilis]|uniref:hypothetical protein n=1 Tax=Streptomyces mirabilis TaxID=68239 RepID=UPI0033321738